MPYPVCHEWVKALRLNNRYILTARDICAVHVVIYLNPKLYGVAPE
jgi:hypothetical protein